VCRVFSGTHAFSSGRLQTFADTSGAGEKGKESTAELAVSSRMYHRVDARV
ncbi:uncharacterized protein METZ01_LOCUS85478, partial [marine metagenome]